MKSGYSCIKSYITLYLQTCLSDILRTSIDLEEISCIKYSISIKDDPYDFTIGK